MMRDCGCHGGRNPSSSVPAARRRLGAMCRSIKTLRPPYTEDVTDDDVRAAALQFVRKVSGFRAPAARNAEAFDEAVDAITATTRSLLDRLEVRAAS